MDEIEPIGRVGEVAARRAEAGQEAQGKADRGKGRGPDRQCIADRAGEPDGVVTDRPRPQHACTSEEEARRDQDDREHEVEQPASLQNPDQIDLAMQQPAEAERRAEADHGLQVGDEGVSPAFAPRTSRPMSDRG